jgi:hypothetical protein
MQTTRRAAKTTGNFRRHKNAATVFDGNAIIGGGKTEGFRLKWF